jgi:hypothetical protein
MLSAMPIYELSDFRLLHGCILVDDIVDDV